MTRRWAPCPDTARRLLDLPDMIHIGDGQYTPLALNDILLPLDDLIEGPNGIDLDTYGSPSTAASRTTQCTSLRTV